MKKRLMSFALVMVMMLSIMPVAYAENSVTPTAPSWIDSSEYLIFEGSEMYTPEKWAEVQKQRAILESITAEDIASGDEWKTKIDIYEGTKNDPGLLFEAAMLYYGLFLKGYYSNTGKWYLQTAISKLDENDKNMYQLLLWTARSYCWDAKPGTNSRSDYNATSILAKLVKYDEFYREALLSHSDFNNARHTEAFLHNYDILIIQDDRLMKVDTAPAKVNGTTMVPIRPIAEAIGADVAWDEETQTVTITRAAKEIVLTIGSAEALVNGQPVTLAVAPYKDGSTMLPLRFIAETLSQEVSYDEKNKVVYINEDLSFLTNSNLKAWMLGCSAILAKRNSDDPYLIGGKSRTAANAQKQRESLSSSWGVNSRKDLLYIIASMTDGGHNTSFLYDYALVSSLSDSEYQQLLSDSSGIDTYMWPLVKSLGDKWGDKGIAAWDWYRMVHLASWGYIAGYLELSEVYALVEQQALRLSETFSSWDEATENYMDGYAYWSRTNMDDTGTEYIRRLRIYEELKTAQESDGLLFDPSVWTSSVQGVNN